MVIVLGSFWILDTPVSTSTASVCALALSSQKLPMQASATTAWKDDSKMTTTIERKDFSCAAMYDTKSCCFLLLFWSYKQLLLTYFWVAQENERSTQFSGTGRRPVLLLDNLMDRMD